MSNKSSLQEKREKHLADADFLLGSLRRHLPNNLSDLEGVVNRTPSGKRRDELTKATILLSTAITVLTNLPAGEES